MDAFIETLRGWGDMLVAWFSSENGLLIMTTVALPFAAILAAGLIAVWLSRASIKRLMTHRDDQEKAAAIASLLAVCRRATVWTSLSSAERDHLDYQITESAVRLRMLPIGGADLAAEWAQGMIAEIKRNSAAMIDDAEKGLADLEDGMIRWYRRPRAAKKQFKSEIAYLRANTRSLDADLIARQKQWQARQDGKAAAQPKTAEPALIIDQLITGKAEPVVAVAAEPVATASPAPEVRAADPVTTPFSDVTELLKGAPTVTAEPIAKAS